ncbi:DEAD (Asp-Glu-Ala-Asp) box polypeptide 20 [Podila humilis]|nr:DEAD (Asp-Glu-Ala-Asp) box polypeptide 20 [Podila humilis]
MTTQSRFHSNDVQINEDLDFSSLVSNPVLLQGLIQAGYNQPSPIQLKTIPLGRLGLDLIAQAKSGTGKTIVFSVIAIETVLSSINHSTSSSNDSATPASYSQKNKSHKHRQHRQQQPRAVIIAPTREIAVQIQEVIQSVVQHGLENKIVCHSMIGGMPIQDDIANLQNCSIVVGTPGRIKSLIGSGHLRPQNIRLMVLDEADKLMEDTYRGDVIRIAKGLGKTKQVMAFSATYDDDLLSQLDELVKDPVYVMLTKGTPELAAVMQFYKVVSVPDTEKSASVFMRQNQIAQRKFVELDSLLTHIPFYQAIVFINHRGRAGELVKFMNRQGWPAMHIAAGISQQERLDVMAKARRFEIRVLVCSDLIARGIDIDRVNLVVNLDLPKDPETYLHRIGRTGRFGTAGLAVSLVDEVELKTIEILKDEFSITTRKLPDDDIEYKELIKQSNSRHHERPLQAKDDLEKYQKLETEASKVDRSVRPVCEFELQPPQVGVPSSKETKEPKRRKHQDSMPSIQSLAKKRKVHAHQSKISQFSANKVAFQAQTVDSGEVSSAAEHEYEHEQQQQHFQQQHFQQQHQQQQHQQQHYVSRQSSHSTAYYPYSNLAHSFVSYPIYNRFVYYPSYFSYPTPPPPPTRSSRPVFFPPDLPFLRPPKSPFWEHFK